MLIEPRLGMSQGKGKKKKKASPITLVWFNYLLELLFSWGFIHMMVMNSICEATEGTGVAPSWCCCDVGTEHWEGVGENPSPWGAQRGSGKEKGPRTLKELARKQWQAQGSQGCRSSQRNGRKEMRPGMSVPFSAAHFNLLHTTPGQNNVRFVSNFITNQNLILAWRRRDEQRDRF